MRGRTTASRRRVLRAGPALACALAVLVGLAAARPASSQALVADLSSHLIAITTAFTGTDVVLFGAVDEVADVVVVVRGPTHDVVVRRKDDVAGMWINAESMVLLDVPSFYTVASNRPVDEIATIPVLERHGIGLENLRLEPANSEEATDPRLPEFREALIRGKQREHLYSIEPAQVAFLGGRLFRTNVYFPANVPTGQYTISVFMIRDGGVVSAQTTPLQVSKIGLGAAIFAFAHRESAAYGGIAVLMAVTAGWLAGAFFRRN